MLDEPEKDFYEKGFLGNQITEFVTAVVERHKQFFEACNKINELAYKIMLEIKANNNNPQQLLAATLLIRLLNGFQSVVVLAKLGLAFDAKVVLRGVLESLFIVKLLCEKKDFSLEYVRSDQCRRLLWLNIARNSKAPHFNSLRQIATDAEMEKLKKEIARQGCKALDIADVARRAGLQVEYDTDYRILCEEVHTLPRSIEHLTVIDNSGEPVEFDPNPTDKDLEYVLFTANRALHIALVSVCTFFGVDKTNELQEVNELLKVLGPKVNIRSKSTL